MGRIIRVVVLIIALSILGFVIWLRMTQDGRDFADLMSHQWKRQILRGDDREAIEKLTKLGVRFGRSAPPDGTCVTVDCFGKKLGDEGYRLIGKCSTLEAAQFNASDLNDERMKNLAGLTHLTSLTIIAAPEVTDAGIQNLGLLPELESLILNGTAVGDGSLAQIGQLRELKTLDLSNTKVTDAGMSALGKLDKVQWLLLINTAVTDEGVARLEGLSSLREITLRGTKVTEKGKAQLKKMYPQIQVDDVKADSPSNVKADSPSKTK